MKRLIALFFLLSCVATASADEMRSAGATSQCFTVFVGDNSVNSGIGLSGLAFNTAGLACSYFRNEAATGEVRVAITLATSTLGTYTSGAFKEIDATNMKGAYEFCAPNAALASGAAAAFFHCFGATNMAPMNLRVVLGPVDTNITQIGGQLVSGNNATLNLKQLNVQNSTGDAVVIASSGSNGDGIDVSGNGSGMGVRLTPGATGNALLAIGGATSGSAIKATGTAGNAIGVEIVGQGSGNGLQTTGGSTGAGISAQGGGTSGEGILANSQGSSAIQARAQAGNGHGIFGFGNGAGAGIRGSGGSTGIGIQAAGGSTSGAGINASSTTGDVITAAASAGNGDAVQLTGQGSGVGFNSAISGNITGNLSGSIGSLGAGAITAATFGAAAIDAAAIGTAAIDADAIAAAAITSSEAPNLDAAISSISAGASEVVSSGTAQAVTATTIQLAASEAYGDNVLADNTSIIIDSATTGKGQSRCVKSNVLSTDTVTLVSAWTITPTGTITYRVVGDPNCNPAKWPSSH